MQRVVRNSTIAMAACALCLALGTGAGKQITKPYKITGLTTGEITSVSPDMTITFALHNTGEATHSGKYTNEGTGILSLVTLQGTAEGLFVCANGDEITWTGTVDGTTLTVTATGGTGRFAGGSGGFVATMENIEVDLHAMTISYTFKGTGEVTY